MAASPPPRWVHSRPAVAARAALARLVLAGSLPKLRGNDGATRAIRAALSSTVLGRVPPEERAWIERIEERRRELAESGPRSAAPCSAGPPPRGRLGASRTPRPT